MSNDSGSNEALVPPPQKAVVEKAAISKNLQEYIAKMGVEFTDAIPAEKIQRIAEFSANQVVMRSGPLPDPAELAAFEQISPGFADRIVKMAEASQQMALVQQQHRIAIENQVVTSQQHLASKGQWFAFILALIIVLCATYAAISGFSPFASIMATTTIGGLVAAFLYTQHEQRNEALKKQLQMAALENEISKKQQQMAALGRQSNKKNKRR